MSILWWVVWKLTDNDIYFESRESQAWTSPSQWVGVLVCIPYSYLLLDLIRWEDVRLRLTHLKIKDIQFIGDIKYVNYIRNVS